MSVIHLDPAMVPAALREGYNGKKFKAVVTEQMTVPLDAGLWSGGSRDHYTLIEFRTGREVAFPGQSSSPWDKSRVECPIQLQPGYAVVRHSIFCGKDMGLTFYVHPSNAAALLPAPAAELNEHEVLVLDATSRYKSSYNGKDRYEMALGYDRSMGRPVPSREQWETAKTSLIAKGLLDKRGAITVAGRNARK